MNFKHSITASTLLFIADVDSRLAVFSEVLRLYFWRLSKFEVLLSAFEFWESASEVDSRFTLEESQNHLWFPASLLDDISKG